MNIQSILQKIYPAGSVGPGSGAYQGECISFLHGLAQFGTIGDSYSQKKKYVEANGIIAPNINEIGKGFRIGDLVITSDGTLFGMGSGHGFMVMNQDDQYIYAAEANFGLKKRVTYGRKVAKNDKKIYGIIRAPLTFSAGTTLNLKVSYLMNFSKQWNSSIFGEVSDWFKQHTNIVIDPYPVYTDFQNWWYEYSPYPDGTMGKSMAKAYFDNIVLPLQFPYSNVIALCVDPSQWQGSIIGTSTVPELAWYFPNSNPGHMVIASNENDVSPWYNMKLFKHAMIHEISHHLKFVCGADDDTHIIDNKNKNIEHIFDSMDLTKAIINI